LEAVQYEIPLGSLFEMTSTNFQDQRLKYCPIILKIKAEKLQERRFYNAKYVLQVWHGEGKGGTNAFQWDIERWPDEAGDDSAARKQRKKPSISAWNISNEFIIFRLKDAKKVCNSLSLFNFKSKIHYQLHNLPPLSQKSDRLPKEFDGLCD
jgi:hypothetical protein